MNLSLETVLRCLDVVPIVRENQGIRLAELATRAGVTEKVIVDQIIPTLMLCGAPPYMPHDYVSIWLEGDRVYVEFADHFKRPVTLLPIEITALHLALTTADIPGDRDPAVAARIQALKEKVERALPAEQRIFLEQADRVSVEDNPDRSSPILADLRLAVKDGRKVEIDYLSWGDTQMKRRVVHPHGVLVKDGVTYAISHDELRGHLVSFRLDRIHRARLLADRFEKDSAFSLDAFAREGFFAARGTDDFEIRVRVRGRTARFLAETTDQRQWTWSGDDLILRVPTSRPRAAVRWVLSLGAEAVIEEPEEALRIAREEITAIRARY